MTNIDKLRKAYEKAEQEMYAITNEFVEKRDKLRAEYEPKATAASEEAARLQKELCDAEAAAEIAGRDIPDEDKQRLADTLGLTLP